jgi:hypothetical protein
MTPAEQRMGSALATGNNIEDDDDAAAASPTKAGSAGPIDLGSERT